MYSSQCIYKLRGSKQERLGYQEGSEEGIWTSHQTIRKIAGPSSRYGHLGQHARLRLRACVYHRVWWTGSWIHGEAASVAAE